jgi:SAM-dependent methyltransferase
MDDFSIIDKRLIASLDQLRFVNRFLGGYAATMTALKPFLKSKSTSKIRLLDLGTGVADLPEHIVQWSGKQSPPLKVEIVAIDANPATVAYANQALNRRLPPELRQKISLTVADVLTLPYPVDSFDVVITTSLLHHFSEHAAIQIVEAMSRLARQGIIINDLHRHPLAYYGIKLLFSILPASAMMRNDGPLSVLRSFRRPELVSIAQAAGLKIFFLDRRWAFRWTLTTIDRPRLTPGSSASHQDKKWEK